MISPDLKRSIYAALFIALVVFPVFAQEPSGPGISLGGSEKGPAAEEPAPAGSALEGERHYQEAKEYIVKQDTDMAIFHLKMAIDMGQNDGFAYALLGGLYKIKGSMQEARKCFRTALEKFEEYRRICQKNGYEATIKIIDEDIKKIKEQLATIEE